MSSNRGSASALGGVVAAPVATKKALPTQCKAAVKWADDTALLAVNGAYLPAAPRVDGEGYADACADGLLGDFEWSREPQPWDHTSPYTAYLEVPTSREEKSRLRFRMLTFDDLEKEAGREDGNPTEVAYGWQQGTYRVKTALWEKMRKRAEDLGKSCERATRVFRYAYSSEIHLVHEGSVVRRLCKNLRPPTRDVMDMMLTLGILRWGKLRTFADLTLCNRAHQRAIGVVTAYLDFLSDLLPPGPNGPLIRRGAPRGHEPVRRGVILIGEEIDSMLGWYTRVNIPVYALVSTNEFDIPAELFKPASEPRCSRERSATFGDLKQKMLRARWYAPLRSDYRYIELIGRGYVTRSDERDYKLSDQQTSLKRRGENIDAAHKRARDVRGRVERQLQSRFPVLGSSVQRYANLVERSPALQRVFAQKPRDADMPQPLPAYAAAELRASQDLNILAEALKHPFDPNAAGTEERNWRASEEERERVLQEAAVKFASERKLLTFLPPFTVLTNCESWEKTVAYAVSAVRMLPLFLDRVRLARTDADVKRLTTQDWRGVLGGQYFKNVWRQRQLDKHLGVHGKEIESRIRLREKEEEAKAKGEGKQLTKRDLKRIRAEEEKRGLQFEEYDHGRFWKYGDDVFFGKDESARLQSQPSSRPRTGVLPCGCEPTIELLKGDRLLVSGILFLMNTLVLVHWLAGLLDDEVAERAGIPRIADAGGEHRTPDLTSAAEREGFVRERILPALRCDGLGGDYWPTLSREAASDRGGDWAHGLLWILEHSPYGATLDREKRFDDYWLSLEGIRSGADKVQELEFDAHVLHRYFLASFKRRQWPFEILDRPLAGAFKCEACRASSPQEQHVETGGESALSKDDGLVHYGYDSDLSNEESDNEGMSD
ncbi:unnamed protein product [Peniophora sp. CBMAI 1063]|nr:unnamed protein product [Peniophora sp. CBMAI 1063]